MPFQTQVAPNTIVAFVAKISVQEQFLLSALTPSQGGNTGDVTVIIRGDGFLTGATARLVGAGGEIVSDARHVNSNTLVATFNLRGTAQGVYDVMVTNPDGNSATLPGGFTVEEGRTPQMWVDVLGRAVAGRHRESTFAILCGNRSNTDALGVLLTISILDVPKEAIVRLGSGIGPTPLPPELEPFRLDDEIPLAIDTDEGKVIMLFIGIVPPGVTSFTVRLNPKIPIDQASFQIKATVSPPFFGSPIKPLSKACIAAMTDAILTEVLSAFVELPPGVDCLLALEDLIIKGLSNFVENAKEAYNGTLTSADILGRFTSILGAHLNAQLQCATDLVGVVLPEAKVLEFILKMIAKIPTYLEAFEACSEESEDSKDVLSVGAFDPNDKVGAGGAGAQRFISGEEPLRYAVFFENIETATAPAQEVVITDQLDPTTMDLSTFSDLRPAQNLIVRIVVQLDLNTGLLTYRFTSLDPATGQLPDDPLAGFLPPNVNPPEGDGSVVFTVMPKQGLPTGTVIRNQARIIFDVNPPIDTPEWFNTIDNSKPTSQIAALPAISPTSFTLQWSGNDAGSGVRDFTVFVSDDGGPFEPLLINTTQTSTTFQGQFGHTYGFIVVARDNTFNIEETPSLPDAVTSAVNAVDVTAQLRINRGKVNQPTTGRGYVRRTFRGQGGRGPATQVVTIKNKGNSPIAGPLSRARPTQPQRHAVQRHRSHDERPTVRESAHQPECGK